MASKALDSIVANPNWKAPQRTFFHRLRDALPVLMGYLEEEIPVMDNHTIQQVVDETGLLKQVKKTAEKAEKAHVERLKARMGDRDSQRGEAFEAVYRGSSRVILNQEKCKEVVAMLDEEGVHLGRLISALKSGQLACPDNVLLQDETGSPGQPDFVPAETNRDTFYTTAAGGRSLYVEPIS